MTEKLVKSKEIWSRVLILAVLVCVMIFVLTTLGGMLLTHLTAEPLFEDTNIEIISINKVIYQGAKDFNIETLRVGDNYSVLEFESIGGDGFISGAKLYQDGEELKYISAGRDTYGSDNNSYENCAIAYEPANGLENIELRVQNIVDINIVKRTFPLTFENNTSVAEVEINGGCGTMKVTLFEDGVEIDREGLEEAFEISYEMINGTPVFRPKIIFMKDGEKIEGSCSLKSPPDALKIVYQEYIKDEEIIIIPIS